MAFGRASAVAANGIDVPLRAHHRISSTPAVTAPPQSETRAGHACRCHVLDCPALVPSAVQLGPVSADRRPEAGRLRTDRCPRPMIRPQPGGDMRRILVSLTAVFAMA